MPIFEYACKECGTEFETLVLPGKEPPGACPSCNAPEVERLFSLPAVQTDETRAKSVASAQRRKKKLGEERVQEQRKYEEAHEGH